MVGLQSSAQSEQKKGIYNSSMLVKVIKVTAVRSQDNPHPDYHAKHIEAKILLAK